jgi:hypothetical protein
MSGKIEVREKPALQVGARFVSSLSAGSDGLPARRDYL